MKMNQTLSLCMAALLVLSACKNTEIPINSEIDIPHSFNQAQAAQGQSDISKWWKNWHDPVLNQLIEQGLTQGYDIRIALSRLNEARANSQLANADLGPNVAVTGNAGITRGKIDNPLSGSLGNLASQYPQAEALSEKNFDLKSNHLGAGLTASWEPDIFGQKRSDVDAAHYVEIGQQEQVYGAQLLLAGEIADNYFKARAAQGRLKTITQTVATMKRMVQYVEGRFKAGHVSGYELNEAKVQLTASEAKQSTLKAEYDAYVRNIAILTGQVPQSFYLPASSVDVLVQQPLAPSGQTPQGLLERRPDLRAHMAQVHAYAAKLSSAKADLLPRFSINFLGEGGRIGIDGNSSLTGWASLLSVGIQVPIFTNGRIQANIAAADARLQTALLQYDQQVLTALGEVDSAYQSVYALQRQNALLQKAHMQAAKHAIDTEKLFRNDYKTLDNALTAHLNEYQMQENLIQARLAKAQMLISLYKALGGGWSID